MNYRKLVIGIGIGLGVLVLLVALAIMLFSAFAPKSFVGGVGGGGIAALESFAPAPSFFGEARSVAQDGAGQHAGLDRKVIRTGNLTLLVDSTEESVEYVTSLIEGKEGIIASLRVVDRGEFGKQAYVTARIPADLFLQSIQELKDIARVVEDEQISGQDITEEFVDLEAQLRNQKATETQLLQVLNRANTVEDILNVRDRLSQVRGEIERLEGRIRYLTDQIDLATIYITISQEPTVALSLRDFRPVTILKTSLRALVQGLIVIFNVLVTFVIVWVPIIVVLLLLLVFLGRFLWKLFPRIISMLRGRQ